MKRFISLILLITVISGLCGCTTATQDESFKIVASFYPVMLIAKMATENIDGVTVTTLASADTGCLHDYALMPNDMKNLETADMFVINGLGMESFIDKIVSQMPTLNTVDLSDGVTVVNNNPHIWLTPQNAKIMLDNLCKSLVEIFPEHNATINGNKEKYSEKFDALDEKITQEREIFKGTKVITCHEAFDYFASQYNLEIAGTIQREPGEEPTTKELVETTNLIKEKDIKILLAEPQYSTTAADTLARETGAIVYMLDPVVTGDIKDSPETYFEKMENNLNILKQAIRKE